MGRKRRRSVSGEDCLYGGVEERRRLSMTAAGVYFYKGRTRKDIVLPCQKAGQRGPDLEGDRANAKPRSMGRAWLTEVFAVAPIGNEPLSI